MTKDVIPYPCYQCLMFVMCKVKYNGNPLVSVLRLSHKCPELKSYIREDPYKGLGICFNRDKINKVVVKFKWKSVDYL